MAADKVAGWLNGLVALWHADSLEAWIAKLIGVFLLLLVLTAMVASLQARSAKVSLVSAGARPRRVAGAALPKNRKKKQDKIVRRYRPRSHDGKKKLIRRAGQQKSEKQRQAGVTTRSPGQSRSQSR